MTLAADIAADVEETFEDWARDDITRNHRTVTDVSETGSTPTYSENVTVITGVFTVIEESLRESVFGGMEDGDAVLAVLPSQEIEYEDRITVDGINYYVKEIRGEDAVGTPNQKFCKLIRL